MSFFGSGIPLMDINNSSMYSIGFSVFVIIAAEFLYRRRALWNGIFWIGYSYTYSIYKMNSRNNILNLFRKNNIFKLSHVQILQRIQ